MLENYYKILGIEADSDINKIKRTFRQMALKLHPDVNDSADAKEKFQELCEAYEVILAHLNQPETISADREFIEREDLYSWEEIMRQAHEKARKRAQMKYEKLKAEQELFENSIWKDIVIILKYIGSFFALILGLWLVTWSVYTVISNGLNNFIALFMFFIVGALLLTSIFRNPKKWFLHGIPRLHLSEIIDYFDFSEFSEVNTECAYCRSLKARGRPFHLIMLKVRSVEIKNEGVAQHYARFKRNYKDLFIPRSKKAFFIHFIISWIKIATIIVGSIYFPSPSFIWRFVISSFAAGILSGIILLLSSTRSKVSFLLTPFNLIKICIWLLAFATQTYILPGFIIAGTEQLIILIIIMVLFLDMIMDLIFRLTRLYPKIYYPIPSQLPGIDYLFKNGYQTYLDVPVWSTIYPFFRWLF